MFGRVLKGLVVAAGVGFAIGMAAARSRHPRGNSGNSPDAVPALEQLERIESRITAAEARSLPAEAELDLRMRAQSTEIETLRLQMNEYRQRISSDVALIQKGLADITKRLPALLEATVAPRVDDLRLHLQSETQQSLNAGMTAFERVIGEKVSNRVAALEKVMLDQSALVTALSHRAIESDMNLERLISTLGRLFDRTNETPGLVRDAGFTGLAA